MRYITFLFLSLFLSATSQVSRTEMLNSPEKCGGIYYAYPAPGASEVENHVLPEGYEPFYISHYGRHGSRYLISDNDYSRVTDLFDKASADGELTPLGEDLKNRLHLIYEEARGREGELTPLGNRQHHDIATRMYATYPQVFNDSAEITAQSTQVMRCAHSMFSFTEGLKEQNPNLIIPRESSRRNMDFLCWWTQESADFNNPEGPTKKVLSEFRDSKKNPERLISSLFKSSDYLSRQVDPKEFMWWIYWITVDLQNMETDIKLSDILTAEELFDLWQVFNFDFYIHNASYPLSNGVHVNNAKHLLKNFVDKAEEYITEGKEGATLRFGHDGNITPFLALIQVDNCYGEENLPDSVMNVWNDFYVSPMAANIQMIFFKNNDNDVIVSILHNERQVGLNMESDIYPFYRWNQLKPYFEDRLSQPYCNFMGK